MDMKMKENIRSTREKTGNANAVSCTVNNENRSVKSIPKRWRKKV